MNKMGKSENRYLLGGKTFSSMWKSRFIPILLFSIETLSTVSIGPVIQRIYGVHLKPMLCINSISIKKKKKLMVDTSLNFYFIQRFTLGRPQIQIHQLDLTQTSFNHSSHFCFLNSRPCACSRACCSQLSQASVPRRIVQHGGKGGQRSYFTNNKQAK